MNTPPPKTRSLNQARRTAVRLRQQGLPLREIRARTGLSTPTIIAACKAFACEGWEAVGTKPRGRQKGSGRALNEQEVIRFQADVCGHPPTALGLPQEVWNKHALHAFLQQHTGRPLNERTVVRYLENWGWHFPNMQADIRAQRDATTQHWLKTAYAQLLQRAHSEGAEVLWCTVWQSTGTPSTTLLVARSKRGTPYWLGTTQPVTREAWAHFARRLQRMLKQKLFMIMNRNSDLPQTEHRIEWHVLPSPSTPGPTPIAPPSTTYPVRPGLCPPLSHLDQLEAESIYILREVVAEADNPIMLYSIGKDSSVMLHLAQKAFWPGRLPFPLLHIDTGWKFRDMYRFRDQRAKEVGAELLIYTNPEGLAQKVTPFTHGSSVYTHIMKTEALKQALDKYQFDVAFGGARRDEEKSRAKERICSFRTADHRWDPKKQRPELWHLYNTRKHSGESLRVFPLSNWTELDIWLYIHRESIPIVPLYFAAQRPVITRHGQLIMLDDDRFPLQAGEVAQQRNVRFRTLGCYPLTAAIDSEAYTLTDIIQEMLQTSTSERQGRLIDADSPNSMEKKKQEGYF